MAPLPQAIQNLFGVGEVEAFAMASHPTIEARAKEISTHDLVIINRWLGTVFAVVEHERRRRVP
jgi:hypothetical protein